MPPEYAQVSVSDYGGVSDYSGTDRSACACSAVYIPGNGNGYGAFGMAGDEYVSEAKYQDLSMPGVHIVSLLTI